LEDLLLKSVLSVIKMESGNFLPTSAFVSLHLINLLSELSCHQ